MRIKQLIYRFEVLIRYYFPVRGSNHNFAYLIARLNYLRRYNRVPVKIVKSKKFFSELSSIMLKNNAEIIYFFFKSRHPGRPKGELYESLLQ